MDAKWKQYEFMVVNYHCEKYKHTVWHTDAIPEEELWKAGFITDFNRHRLGRIARKREAKGKEQIAKLNNTEGWTWEEPK